MAMVDIERFAYTPHGTFGRLSFADFSCYTVERQWLNNKPSESCIPEGDYTLSRYKSPKFGQTYAVIGGDVSLYPDVAHSRSGILIHIANVATDLEGCIGLGDSLGYVKAQWAVLNSAITLREFFDKIHAMDNLSLSITFKIVDTSIS